MLDNAQALQVQLTSEQMDYIESFAAFEPGYPATVFGQDPHIDGSAAIMTRSAAHTKWVKFAGAIGSV